MDKTTLSNLTEIRFQCTADDYVEAQRAHARRLLKYQLYLFAAISCTSFSAYEVVFSRVDRVVFAPLVAAVCLLMPRLSFPWRIRQEFRKHPHLGLDAIVVAGEEGLQGRSDIGEGISKWAAFTKFRETQNLFMLYTGPRLFRMIPKRAFSRPQLHEFRELLRSKMPANN